jgi:hypothetical protein
VEWLELYVAIAKAGLVAVPINFRLVGPEIQYIAENAEAKAFIVQAELVDRIDAIRANLPIAAGCYIHFGSEPTPPGYAAYEAIIAAASASEPTVQAQGRDPDARGDCSPFPRAGCRAGRRPAGHGAPRHADVPRELALFHVRVRVLRSELLRV